MKKAADAASNPPSPPLREGSGSEIYLIRAEDPALGKMRKTTGVEAEKVEGDLSSDGFMTSGGPWYEKREDGHCLAQRRCWGEKEASELIDERECCDRPTRDIRSNAEALEKGGNNDGVGAIG